MTKKLPSTAGIVLRHTLGSKWFVSILAVVVVFALGVILIVIARTFVFEAYYAMLHGTVFNPEVSSLQRQIKPITSFFFYATPLIIDGLGLSFDSRAGLFNIDGQGQVIFGALATVQVGFSLYLPPILYTILVPLTTIITGALYADIADLLKACIGANEVIVTIILNSIAGLVPGYVLVQEVWQVPGSNQPQTSVVADTTAFTPLLPNPFRLHADLIVTITTVIVFQWTPSRSTLGFRVKAVGANPDAVRTAGISVECITTIIMIISGASLGLTGMSEVLGTIGYVSRDVVGSIGSDTITVAPFGRSEPVGTFFTGLFFGAFKVDRYVMQPKGVPIDIVSILQSVIVLFIVAPVLMRRPFHLSKGSEKPLRIQLAALVQTPASATAQSQASKQVSAARTFVAGTGDETVNLTASHKEGDAQ